MDDEPQYTVIIRRVGTRFTMVHSRHEDPETAEQVREKLAWDLNRRKVTCHLMVIEL